MLLTFIGCKLIFGPVPGNFSILLRGNGKSALRKTNCANEIYSTVLVYLSVDSDISPMLGTTYACPRPCCMHFLWDCSIRSF
jgi:hypothetical protein